MKYVHACQVKVVVGKAIVILEKAIQEGKVSPAAMKRLATAYMS